MSRSLAIFRHNARLLLLDPGPVFVFFLTPVMVMAIMKPSLKFILANEDGGRYAAFVNGSEHAVPAFVAMFAFFWIGFVGRNFISEHGWGTWERLRASFASPAEVMIGKVLPAFVLITAQVVILFAIGAFLFDMDSQGPVLSLAVIVIPLVTCVLGLCLVLVGICRTLTEIDAIGNMFTMLFAAIGGCLIPQSTLPELAQDIAPATPTYWAVKASHEVILEGDGLSATLPAAGALLGFTLLFGVIAFFTFKFGEVKIAT